MHIIIFPLFGITMAAAVTSTNNDDLLRTVVVALLSGGLASGVLALVTKRVRSPESQNELARLGNEFASKLLEDARQERVELRTTIQELETSNSTKQETIDRLNALLQQKDRRIDELETRQQIVARKFQAGEKISLSDIFGQDAPSDIHVVVDNESIIA